VSAYIQDKIKTHYIDPFKAVTLNMTIKEAEILMSANPDVRAMAEKGDLKALHEKFSKTEA
jgi:hypothetical protein